VAAPRAEALALLAADAPRLHGGLGLHYFHGAKRQRGYADRWRILAENRFNPDDDLSRDAQGLYQLMDRHEPRNVRLRDQLRHYFRSRNEDSIEV
jgi:hypothetical protein